MVHFYCLDPSTGAMQWHVKRVRGLSTESLTPQRPASGTGVICRGAHIGNIPNYDARPDVGSNLGCGVKP